MGRKDGLDGKDGCCSGCISHGAAQDASAMELPLWLQPHHRAHGCNSGKKIMAVCIIKPPWQSSTSSQILNQSRSSSTLSSTGDKKGAVHVATPHPAKKAGKTPATSEKSPKSGGSIACKSCSKTFNNEGALASHSKAKHEAYLKILVIGGDRCGWAHAQRHVHRALHPGAAPRVRVYNRQDVDRAGEKEGEGVLPGE